MMTHDYDRSPTLRLNRQPLPGIRSRSAYNTMVRRPPLIEESRLFQP